MGSGNERTSGFKRVTSWHQWGTGHWHTERLYMRQEFSRDFPMAPIPSTYQMALQNISGSFVFLPLLSWSWFIGETKRKVERGNLLRHQESCLLGTRGRWDTESKTISSLLSVPLQPQVYLPASLAGAGAVSRQQRRGVMSFAPSSQPSTPFSCPQHYFISINFNKK